MYYIYIGNRNEAAVTVYIDGHNPSAVPPFILAGVGDKKKRYSEWLEKSLNENTRLLNFLAYVHNAGKEQGSIALVCNCSQNKYHAICIKEFLVKHHETLDAILPYLFPKVNQVTDSTTIISSEENTSMEEVLRDKIPDFQMGIKQDKLSPTDMEQIISLIKADQEQNNGTENFQDTITPS